MLGYRGLDLCAFLIDTVGAGGVNHAQRRVRQRVSYMRAGHVANEFLDSRTIL